MRLYLIIFLAFIVGVIVGYVAHIISLNVWLVQHGINPKDFFENGKTN